VRAAACRFRVKHVAIARGVSFGSKKRPRRAKPSATSTATAASPQTAKGARGPNGGQTTGGAGATPLSPSGPWPWKSEPPALVEPDPPAQKTPGVAGGVYRPTPQPVKSFPPVNVKKAARQEALEPALNVPLEIKSINPPKEPPDRHFGVPVNSAGSAQTETPGVAEAPPSFGTGVSPGPTKTFKGEFLSATTIPPDTMGAVGTTHIVTVSNDRMRIQTRDGVEISRLTISSFWSGVTIKGAAASAFDTKVYFDRFNNRFIIESSANGTSVNSGALFAVSATADPTGTWYRWSVVADPVTMPLMPCPPRPSSADSASTTRRRRPGRSKTSRPAIASAASCSLRRCGASP